MICWGVSFLFLKQIRTVAKANEQVWNEKWILELVRAHEYTQCLMPCTKKRFTIQCWLCLERTNGRRGWCYRWCCCCCKVFIFPFNFLFLSYFSISLFHTLFQFTLKYWWRIHLVTSTSTALILHIFESDSLPIKLVKLGEQRRKQQQQQQQNLVTNRTIIVTLPMSSVPIRFRQRVFFLFSIQLEVLYIFLGRFSQC